MPTAAIKGSTLNASSLDNLVVALPPLAEQERITQRVDALLGFLDALEGQLDVVQSTQTSLAASVLHHVDLRDPGLRAAGRSTTSSNSRELLRDFTGSLPNASFPTGHNLSYRK